MIQLTSNGVRLMKAGAGLTKRAEICTVSIRLWEEDKFIEAELKELHNKLYQMFEEMTE